MNASDLWHVSARLHRAGYKLPARLIKTVIFVIFGAVLPPETRFERDIELWHHGLGIVIHPNVVIGRNVQIGHRVTIAGTAERGPMIIEDDVKIAAHAIIIPRRGEPLTLGKGSVVGAGAVVTDSVPAGAVVAGNPARETSSSRERRLRTT